MKFIQILIILFTFRVYCPNDSYIISYSRIIILHTTVFDFKPPWEIKSFSFLPTCSGWATTGHVHKHITDICTWKWELNRGNDNTSIWLQDHCLKNKPYRGVEKYWVYTNITCKQNSTSSTHGKRIILRSRKLA